MKDDYWGRKYIIDIVGEGPRKRFMKKNGKPFTSKELTRADFVVEDLGNGTYRVIKDRTGKVDKIITGEDLFTELI